MIPTTWTPRTEAELLADQIAGLAAFHHSRGSGPTPEPLGSTREAQLDGRRRTEVAQREQVALLAAAARQLLDCVPVLRRAVQPRAVLAHRNEWLRSKVADGLTARGVRVVAVLEDGAEASGVVVMEQPDLLLVEDRLPSLSGLEVVQRVRSFAPRTFVAAQVLDDHQLEPFFEDGARAVFTRRVPPADIVDQLVQCLLEAEAPFALA